jgi:hypothetical protein
MVLIILGNLTMFFALICVKAVDQPAPRSGTWPETAIEETDMTVFVENRSTSPNATSWDLTIRFDALGR